MKEHETIGEGIQNPQQSPSKPTAQPHVQESDLVADLLRDRLATKLTEGELTSLIKEVAMLCKTSNAREAVHTNSQKHPQSGKEARVSNLKNSINKCREIERALHATDRHVRLRGHEHRERVFRDRSPLGVRDLWSSDGLMYGCLNPVSSTLTSTRVGPAIHRSHNPWLDSYFS